MRLVRSRHLLRRFPAAAADLIFITDEKVFTVAPAVNLQSDRVYALTGTKKREIASERRLRTRSTFSKSVMISVAVSKLDCSGLVFVEPGVKVNGQYYRDVLLSQDRLPAIRHIADDTSFSKIAHRRIVHVRRSNFCVARLLISSDQICGNKTVQIGTRLTSRSVE